MTNKISHELLARWKKVPPAVVADVSKGAGQIDPAIRPLLPPGQQPKLFGLAITAKCNPPDFGAVLCALDSVQQGDVLVIAAGGNTQHAMLGGILGGVLARKHAAGIVCDGAVRDVGELANFKELSVFARSITPRGPTSASGEGVNVPVVIGGRNISSGDLVIGDDDGLVSLSPTDATAWIEAAEAKLALEDEWQAKLRAGQTVRTVFAI